MTDENLKKIVYFLLAAVLFISCWLAIITGYVVAVCEDVLNLTNRAETEPTTQTEIIETTINDDEPIVIETYIPETTEETTPIETIIPEPTETIKVIPEETEPCLDEHEVEMLACVIFQEAGWDLSCDDCRRRVADVVLNRVADPRFPNSIYEVLTQKDQYGRYYYTGIKWPSYASNANEKYAVERAYRIAREVLSGQHSDVYGKGYIWQATFKQSNDNIYCCGHYYGR